MMFDDIDIKVLRENYDDETISNIDMNNASKILAYLINDGVYYAKDIFISSLELFDFSYDEFVKRFERLKSKLGDNYIDLLGEDASLIDKIYED